MAVAASLEYHCILSSGRIAPFSGTHRNSGLLLSQKDGADFAFSSCEAPA